MPTRPSIRFTTASDGVDIGYWEIGAGPPLLLAQNRSLSHAELEWDVPSMSGLYLELARYFRLIRFDPRGSGISGEPADGRLTLHGLAGDIAAVVDALGIDQINVIGAVSMGPAAVRYAAARPDTTARLVLCDTGPVLANLPLDAYVRATDSLVDLGVVPSLGALFPSTPTDDLPALERLMRASLYDRPHTEPRDLRTFDVTDLLGEVRCPTMVMKSDKSVYTDMTQTRALLSGVPGAELKNVPGTMAPWLADRDAVVDSLVSFLTERHHVPGPSHRDRLLTIVFTDLVSSTEMIDREGDQSARRAFGEIETLVSELTSSHGGHVVKNLGDGSLLTFESTRMALSFALELQEQMTSRPVQMRIGMAAGEPILEGDDVHGTAVVQASRIANLGEAGEVLVSDSIRQLAAGKEFDFESRGQVRLKGFEDEETVWRASRSPLG